jgi:hypothetical protein
MNKDQIKGNATKPASHSKAEARPATERASLAGERAEGEGMIAPAPEEPAESDAALEGEGSYTAARRYEEGVTRSIEKGDTERLAKEAVRALAGPEGADLRRAEQDAKRGPRHTK